MEGYEAFKKLRADTGMTIRSFAAKAEISPRVLTYYESGEKSLLCIPTEKAVSLFSILTVSLPDFYFRYYPIKEEVNRRIEKWNAERTRITDREQIKTRLKNRIFQMRSRALISASEKEFLLTAYESQMSMMAKALGNRKKLTDTEYEQFVLPVLYLIKSASKQNSVDQRTFVVKDAICHTEYSIRDLADIVGVSQQHLKGRLNKNELEKLHVETVLKLCLALDISFESIFEVEVGSQ